MTNDHQQTGTDHHHVGWFEHFSTKIAHWAGRPVVFGAACLLIIVWAATGPLLGFSDLWQLTINTATTIVTFLMVFVIQNTQNRESAAVQIKLDELIRATKAAQNSLLDLEDMSEEELERFRSQYEKLARLARQNGQIPHCTEEGAEDRPPSRRASRRKAKEGSARA